MYTHVLCGSLRHQKPQGYHDSYDLVSLSLCGPYQPTCVVPSMHLYPHLGGQCKREITSCTTIAMELPPDNSLRASLLQMKTAFENLLDQPLWSTKTIVWFGSAYREIFPCSNSSRSFPKNINPTAEIKASRCCWWWSRILFCHVLPEGRYLSMSVPLLVGWYHNQ